VADPIVHVFTVDKNTLIAAEQNVNIFMEKNPLIKLDRVVFTL